MLPDRVSNTGPLTYESGALPIALRGPAGLGEDEFEQIVDDTRHTTEPDTGRSLHKKYQKILG